MKFLSILATSALYERVWIIKSRIITKVRAILHSHFVSVLIFLKENGEILKKHYSSIEGRDRILPTVYGANVNNLVGAVECMILDEIDNKDS